MLEDDERAGFLLRHLEAGAGELLGGLVVQGLGIPAEQAVDEVAPLSRDAGGAPHPVQELAYLRLEDDYQGDCAHVDDGVQQGGEQLHVHRHRDDAVGQ